MDFFETDDGGLMAVSGAQVELGRRGGRIMRVEHEGAFVEESLRCDGVRARVREEAAPVVGGRRRRKTGSSVGTSVRICFPWRRAALPALYGCSRLPRECRSHSRLRPPCED